MSTSYVEGVDTEGRRWWLDFAAQTETTRMYVALDGPGETPTNLVLTLRGREAFDQFIGRITSAYLIQFGEPWEG